MHEVLLSWPLPPPIVKPLPPGQVGKIVGVPPGHGNKPGKWFK